MEVRLPPTTLFPAGQTHQNQEGRARGSRLVGRRVVLFPSPESARSAVLVRSLGDHPGLAKQSRPHQATAGLHQLAACSALPSVQFISRGTGNRIESERVAWKGGAGTLPPPPVDREGRGRGGACPVGPAPGP